MPYLHSTYKFEKMLEQGIIDGFYLNQTWNQQTWFVLFILYKNSSASYFQFGIKIELYILMAFLVHRSPSKVKNRFWTAGKKNWISAWNTMFWCSIPKRNSNFLLLCVCNIFPLKNGFVHFPTHMVDTCRAVCSAQSSNGAGTVVELSAQSVKKRDFLVK